MSSGPSEPDIAQEGELASDVHVADVDVHGRFLAPISAVCAYGGRRLEVELGSDGSEAVARRTKTDFSVRRWMGMQFHLRHWGRRRIIAVQWHDLRHDAQS